MLSADSPLACSPRHQSCFRVRPNFCISTLPSFKLRATNKWEVGRVPRRSLDEKFVSPAVQRLETLGIVHVVDQNAAISTSVERYAEGLETFLTGRIPELSQKSQPNVPQGALLCPCPTCMVTCRSSTRTSRVRKSAPIVAL